ncbi:DoxX family protein [Qipengyuania nanhaisediminis]|uniref:DoxX family protein n=1 Tax=Qipengyuania nanhaisediminis TaxID=604088 RepID=UPI0038B32CC2
MPQINAMWSGLVRNLSNRFFEGIALLLARTALGLIFFRSYQTKVTDEGWFAIDQTQYLLFANEFTGLPLSPEIAVPLTTYSEFLFPILLFAGLASRISASALAVMALVIQAFVFPSLDHFFGWAITVFALAAIVISRGAGVFSIDALLARGWTMRAR